MAAISGNTGSVTGGVVGVLNTWSATVSRAVSDVTGFGNSGRHRILGVYDMTGSAGGIMDDSTSFVSTNEIAAMTATTGASITLTAQSGNTIGANVVVDSVSLGSSKTGDATLSFNFSLAAGTTTSSPFTISWS
jgi:hypothetical protein